MFEPIRPKCEPTVSDYRWSDNGLFGECTRNGDSALILSSPLDEDDGYGLLSPRTQCLLIYFKLSLAYQLRYDADFCDVRNPTNVWQLLQIVKLELSKKNGFTAKLDDDEANSHAALARELHEAAAGLFGQQPFREAKNNSEDANNVDIPLSAEEEQFLEGYLNDVLANQVPDLG
uniref:Uncharacterized protein n=1 Tax=Parascaris equorum TaxID=6256 RepID=A0A914RAF8_PAREQ